LTDEQTPNAPEAEPATAPAPEPAVMPSPLVPVTGDPIADATPEKKSAGMQYGYYWGTGRRKAAVARVRIRPGDGKFLINKKAIDEYFRVAKDRKDVTAPLTATQSGKHVDVFVNVRGGGTTGQSGAIVLGLARALCKLSAEHEPSLRDGNFLTRDSRRVERKKYGQRGARRRFQFSKR